MTNKDWDVVREGLLPLSDDELEEVNGVVAKLKNEYPSVNWGFMKLAIRNGGALEAARTARYICGDAHAKGLPDTNKTFGEILVGLVEREQLVKDFALPEDRAENIKATALVTQAILEYADNYNAAITRTVINTYHLKDHELVGFIGENTDRADDIVNAIRARGTVDVGMLRELLDHDVKSLTSGVL